MIDSLLKFIVRSGIKVSSFGFRSRGRVTRYYMYDHLSSVFKAYSFPASGAKVLSISHSDELIGLLGLKDPKIVEANYPDHNMLGLKFDDNEFDIVVSDQVLEHVDGDPQKAIDESRRVLKSGGLAIHTTCFLNPVHGCPSDYWRFTPEALKLLCGSFSKVLDVGGWGNPYVLLFIWSDMRFHPIPDAKWHPLHKLAIANYPAWPVVAWIVCQK